MIESKILLLFIDLQVSWSELTVKWVAINKLVIK